MGQFTYHIVLLPFADEKVIEEIKARIKECDISIRYVVKGGYHNDIYRFELCSIKPDILKLRKFLDDCPMVVKYY